MIVKDIIVTVTNADLLKIRGNVYIYIGYIEKPIHHETSTSIYFALRVKPFGLFVE